MHIAHSLSLLLLCTILLPPVQSFASWFVKDYCNRKLVEGEVIMNNEVLEDESRSLKVFRNNQELQSNIDSYVPGEELIVTISDKSGGIQYVFETTPPAKFISGGCENEVRIVPTTHAKLLIPTEYTESIRVWGGWATGHEAVKLIKDFILLPPKSADNINIDSTQCMICTHYSFIQILTPSFLVQNKKRKGLFHQNRTQPIVLTTEKKRTMIEETIELQRNKLRGSVLINTHTLTSLTYSIRIQS
jgi:hypothetical protein